MSVIRDIQASVKIGEINLPTGAIVACDPFFCGIAIPFLHRVRNGKYPVFVDIVDLAGWGKRVTAAEILFDERISPEFYVKSMKQDDSNAYFVDTGIGSFMDESTRLELVNVMEKFYSSHPDGNYYSDVIEAEFRNNATVKGERFADGLWVMYRLPNSELNVAMFTSGLGDGYYESFWGIAEENRIVSLITDFGFGEFIANIS